MENLPEEQREQAALEAVELAKAKKEIQEKDAEIDRCLLYTSPEGRVP